MKIIKLMLLMLVISALTFEFLSYIASRNKLLVFNNSPPYEIAFDGEKWRNEKHIWGAWHKSNAVDKHVTTCFKVDYQSNNVGARDNVAYDGTIHPKSVAIIGDSFVEGIGLQLSDTFSKNLHKYYGQAGLNFGASGDFGPVQQYLLYRHLIKKLPHGEVILFVLPINDFTDNSDRHMKRYGTRYRPYFKKDDAGEYEIIYPKVAKPSDQYPSDKSGLRTGFVDYVFKTLNGYTYSSNALRSLLYLYKIGDSRKRDEVSELNNRGYFINNTYDVEGSLYFIRKLMDEVPSDIKKHIVVIPTTNDFKNIERFGFAYKKLPWYVGLRDIAKKHRTRFIDLAASYMAGGVGKSAEGDYSEWFLSCDPHWSARGNLLALKLFLKGTSAERK